MIFYGVSYDNNVRIKTVRRLANKVKDLQNGFAEAIKKKKNNNNNKSHNLTHIWTEPKNVQLNI